MTQAADYAGLVIKSQNGSALRLSDVASVVDGVANTGWRRGRARRRRSC